MAGFPATALRAGVLFPAAAAEGALAVLLPWALVQLVGPSIWLGPLAAGLVLAPLVGSLAASPLQGRFGERGMVLGAGLAALLGFGGAAAIFPLSPATAYCLVLLGLAADAACDIGLGARMPVMARLARKPLEGFAAANWGWSVVGAAAGAMAAGWAWSRTPSSTSLLALLLCMTWAWLTLFLLHPTFLRSRLRRARARGMRELSRPRWGAELRILLAVMGLVLVVGPLDNLLIPAQLSAQGRPAEQLGLLLAAGGLGLALGLAAASGIERRWPWRIVLLLALLGLSGVVALLITLPAQGLLIAGVALGAALAAPLLPLCEAALLRAVPAAQRARWLAALAIAIGLADALSTLAYGWLLQHAGSAAALQLSAAMLGAAALTSLGVEGRRVGVPPDTGKGEGRTGPTSGREPAGDEAIVPRSRSAPDSPLR